MLPSRSVLCALGLSMVGLGLPQAVDASFYGGYGGYYDGYGGALYGGYGGYGLYGGYGGYPAAWSPYQYPTYYADAYDHGQSGNMNNYGDYRSYAYGYGESTGGKNAGYKKYDDFTTTEYTAPPYSVGASIEPIPVANYPPLPSVGAAGYSAPATGYAPPAGYSPPSRLQQTVRQVPRQQQVGMGTVPMAPGMGIAPMAPVVP
eukprot:Rmarinus@m.5615